MTEAMAELVSIARRETGFIKLPSGSSATLQLTRGA